MKQKQFSQVKLSKLAVGIVLALGIGTANQGFADDYFSATNGCKVRQSSNEKLSKITYQGSCTKGYASGNGTYTKYDTDNKVIYTYKGQLKDGMEHGKGSIVWQDGDKYEGDFQDNKIHGKGVYTWANGNVYNGGFQNNKRHGKGVFTWANGNKYDGDFYNNKQDGKGVYTWADGGKYEGEWKEGYKVGLGKMTFPKGNKSIAGWEKNNKGFWQGNVYVVQGRFNENKENGLSLQEQMNNEQYAKALELKAEADAKFLANVTSLAANLSFNKEQIKSMTNEQACKERYVGQQVSVVLDNGVRQWRENFTVHDVGKDEMTVYNYDGSSEYTYRVSCLNPTYKW